VLSKKSVTSKGFVRTLSRVGKYVLVRVTMLLLTVVASVYVTILVANMGGYVDVAVKADIDYAIGMSMKDMRGVTAEEKVEIFEQRREIAYDAAGLNEPFVVRCFRWLGRGLTLDWGRTNIDSVAWSSRDRPIKTVVLENLPRTLLVFGTANVALFFTTIFLALPLSRKHGGWMDRLVTGLSPLSAAPAWVYGIILSILSLKVLGGVFADGAFDAWPDQFELAYMPLMLKHLALPTAAIFLSGLFHGVYTWRTLFLLHAQEDHVEVATAKGLPPRMLERRYILRPLLPSLLTSFALLFVSLWQEVIVLEQFFNVAGIGRLFFRAIRRFGRPVTPVVVALVVTFSYLLAITVFLLDVVYALVDPRVRVGGKRRAGDAASRRRKRQVRHWPPWKRLHLHSSSDGPGIEEIGWGRDVDRGGESGSVRGLEAVRKILGDFPSADDVAADWLTEGGAGRVETVDRLYPELGVAIRFVAHDDSVDEARSGAWRQAGIVLIEVDPDRPVSAVAVRQIQAALSAAARRVAQRRGSYRTKLALMPRIAAAKSACEKALDTLERSADSSSRLKPRRTWKARANQVQERLSSLFTGFSRYPSAAFGLLIIVILISVSICTVIVLPYDEMIELWRGSSDVWALNPEVAAPTWINVFRKHDLPETIMMSSAGGDSLPGPGSGQIGVASKSVTAVSDDVTEIAISFPFDFHYGEFPQDLSVYVDASYEEKKPLVTMTWMTPDGREIELDSAQIQASYVYRLSSDEHTGQELGRRRLVEALFSDPDLDSPVPLQGDYELLVKTFVFEEGGDSEAALVLMGQVHGLAGTDGRRRDLLIPLLWGMPVALAFGVLAAVGTSVSSMVIAGIGTWFGGWVDALVQRITELNMILPFLPVSIMVYTLYSKSFWVILGVTVLLSVFGSAIKNYRAIFLQVKEAPYVEAAQAYGTGDWRIIFRYLIPRLIPVLVPQLVILVPSYVFLEATLAFLGLSDPVLPTWGKLMVEGLSHGIHAGHHHLFLEPLSLLLLVAFAFVLLGASLERIFQPRLREI